MENQTFNNTAQHGGSFSSPPHAPHYAPLAEPPPKPGNWMVAAILLLIIPLCTCNPFFIAAIVAIVFASKVNGRYFAGQYAEAEQAAKTAKLWVIIAFIGALVWLIGYQVIWMTVSGQWEVFMDAVREGFEEARRAQDGAW